MIKKSTFLILVVFAFPVLLNSAPFPLSDSDPNSPEFKKRFFGSYGINEDIEPKLSQEDRPLYERVRPFIENNPEGAVELLEKEISGSSNAAFDFLLGNLYYQIDDMKSSEKWLKSSIKKFPSFRRAYRTLALIQVRNERFKEAVPNLLKVITLGGADDQIYGLLAYSYLDQESYKSALGAYNMARMFNPKSEDFKRGEAQCLLMIGRNKEAIALFDELLEETPEKKDYWLLQANAYLGEDRLEDAVSNLEIVRGLKHADFNSLMLLARLYLSTDAMESALSAAMEALQTSEDVEFDSAVAILDYLIDRSSWSRAAQYLESLSKWNSKFESNERYQLEASSAAIDLATGKREKALRTLKKIISEDPLNGRALLQLGNYYLEEEDFAEAEFYFERATSVVEESHKAYLALGKMAVKQRNYSEALNALNKAQQLSYSENVKDYIEQIRNAWEASQN